LSTAIIEIIDPRPIISGFSDVARIHPDTLFDSSN
jgi:hypothetical protein